MTDTKKQDSFLHDTQKEGQGKSDGKLPIEFLDDAIANVHVIIRKDALEEISGKKTEEVDPVKMAIYCHDCRGIVPAGMGRGYKGKMRTVCGLCKSKKISSGRREALEQYYHIPKERHGIDVTPEESAERSRPFNRPPRQEGKKRPPRKKRPNKPRNRPSRNRPPQNNAKPTSPEARLIK